MEHKYKLDEERLSKIRSVCAQRLFGSYLKRNHLDDCTQWVAMEDFRTKGTANWRFKALDYLRMNKLNGAGQKIQWKVSRGMPIEQMEETMGFVEDVEDTTTFEELKEYLVKSFKLQKSTFETLAPKQIATNLKRIARIESYEKVKPLKQVEDEYILETFKVLKGNRVWAAKALGLSIRGIGIRLNNLKEDPKYAKAFPKK